MFERRSLAVRVSFAAAAISLLHAQADFTGFLNFGHHASRHGWIPLAQAVAFAAFGAFSLRNRRRTS